MEEVLCLYPSAPPFLFRCFGDVKENWETLSLSNNMEREGETLAKYANTPYGFYKLTEPVT